jgi:hypothetical protein
MTRLTLVAALTLAVLLLCGSPSQIQAQSDTKIVIKDGGSLLLQADGLDAGKTWALNPNEIKHANENGVLSGVQITKAGADRCKGKPTCGVDTTKPWSITVTYGAGSVAIASLSSSSNKGVHLTHNALPFDQWKRTASADEREFGHGDGHRITAIAVNGVKQCLGPGCVITLHYSPR